MSFFLWNVACSLLGNTTQEFCLFIVVPRVLRHYWKEFFRVQWCYLKRFGQHCTRFLPVQYCPKSIKTTLNKIFFVQCCLEPFGQHCTRFLPVQCCPKSIKTTLNKIFHVKCCLEVLGQGFYLGNVDPWLTYRQLFWVKEPIQHCVYQTGATYPICLNISETTLQRKITDAKLSQTTVIYSLENNHIQCCLDLPESTLH